MAHTIPVVRLDWNKLANKALGGSATLWFLTAVAGQWFFVLYIVSHYSKLALGGVAAMEKSSTPGGYIAGDTLGNMLVASHLLIAIIVIGGGPLQFMPQIRRRFPTFHRWNGRIYMPAVMVTSIAGIYLTWFRPEVADFAQDSGITLDAVLIIVFAAIAWRYARARQFVQHQRWVMRLFLVVNAVWFFRISLMLWFKLTGGFGIDGKTFTGPFLSFLSFADYLIPLIIFELYLLAKAAAHTLPKYGMAIVLIAATILTAAGTILAAMGMWLPRM